MIFMTADSHFGHRNIIKYQKRPFMTQAEMDALEFATDRESTKAVRISNETLQKHDTAIIDNINAVVMPQDTLYHLGDFCMGDGTPYRNRINCRNVHLIKGNHDRPKDQSFWKLFASVKELSVVRDSGKKITLCHYPMLGWDGSHYGHWHLHGHCHGGIEDFIIEHNLQHMKRIDVGVDSHDYKPWNMDEIARAMEQKIGLGLVK